MPLGFGGQGSLEAFLLVLALPGGTCAMGKEGICGALETPLGLLARPRCRRQETEMGGEAWLTITADPRRGWAGLAQLPTSGWGLPELMSAEDTGVESLSPWQVFRASSRRGQYWRIQIHVSLSFTFVSNMGEGHKDLLGNIR